MFYDFVTLGRAQKHRLDKLDSEARIILLANNSSIREALIRVDAGSPRTLPERGETPVFRPYRPGGTADRVR